MSELSELILPVGLVFLGAYVVKQTFAGYSGQRECTGPLEQYCIGPICGSICTSPAVGPAGQIVGPAILPDGSPAQIPATCDNSTWFWIITRPSCWGLIGT